MGTVYRETYTKPLPANAEQFTRKGERFARWRDSKGRKRTAKVTTTNAGDRLMIEAGTFTAKYRTGGGLVVKVATGCRSEDAARAVLGELIYVLGRAARRAMPCGSPAHVHLPEPLRSTSAMTPPTKMDFEHFRSGLRYG